MTFSSSLHSRPSNIDMWELCIHTVHKYIHISGVRILFWNQICRSYLMQPLPVCQSRHYRLRIHEMGLWPIHNHMSDLVLVMDSVGLGPPWNPRFWGFEQMRCVLLFYISVLSFWRPWTNDIGKVVIWRSLHNSQCHLYQVYIYIYMYIEIR